MGIEVLGSENWGFLADMSANHKFFNTGTGIGFVNLVFTLEELLTDLNKWENHLVRELVSEHVNEFEASCFEERESVKLLLLEFIIDQLLVVHLQFLRRH